MIDSRLRVLAIVLLTLPLLAACRLMPEPRPVHVGAPDGVTLRIPEGLDTPVREDAMRVPRVAAARSELDPAVLARPPAALAVNVGGLPEFAGSSYPIADELDSAWRRVGLAVERAPQLTVLRRDEAQRRIEVELEPEVLPRPASGFLGRIFGRDQVMLNVQPPVWVRVREDGAGSLVEVVDERGQRLEDLRARRVLGILSARLG